jgi:mannose-1-phosphate guanylyltransferase
MSQNMSDIKAVILVGGEGTRLRPLTSSVPKPMVPVLNKPFLEHVFRHLASHGVKDIILALCYLPDNIQSYFGDGRDFGINLTYVAEDFPLGTAGAVKNVSQHIDSTFLVLNGDVYTDLDITAMVALHKAKGAQATIALTPVEDPSAYGVVDTDADGRVKCFIEKPKREEAPSNMINAGTYVLEPDVLAHVEPQTFCMFERFLFPLLLNTGQPLYAYPSDAYWIDIGTPENYAKINLDLLSGDVQIDDSVDVHSSAKIIGPVLFGSNCVVEADVVIEGPAVIGSGCIIKSGSIVSRAIIWPDTHIDRQATVQDCVVSAGCRIEANASVVDGAVLGSDVTIGEGCHLSGGVRIDCGKSIDSDTILK